jgi:hypothetical protein
METTLATPLGILYVIPIAYRWREMKANCTILDYSRRRRVKKEECDGNEEEEI